MKITNELQPPTLLQDLGMQYPTKTSTYKTRFGTYKCHCGNTFKATTGKVKNGDIKGCGCLKGASITHGKSKHTIYTVWSNMLKRCSNKEDKNYGGRGITVCERWTDVNNFINDMAPKYKRGLTIDRIDNDKGYSPENCRWVTPQIQGRNTRKLCSTNTSGYRGVSWHKSTKMYRARICVDKKDIHIGLFESKDRAAEAYDKYVIDSNLEHTVNGVLDLENIKEA